MHTDAQRMHCDVFGPIKDFALFLLHSDVKNIALNQRLQQQSRAAATTTNTMTHWEKNSTHVKNN